MLLAADCFQSTLHKAAFMRGLCIDRTFTDVPNKLPPALELLRDELARLPFGEECGAKPIACAGTKTPGGEAGRFAWGWVADQTPFSTAISTLWKWRIRLS